jgi:hypothetical protein
MLANNEKKGWLWNSQREDTTPADTLQDVKKVEDHT